VVAAGTAGASGSGSGAGIGVACCGSGEETAGCVTIELDLGGRGGGGLRGGKGGGAGGVRAAVELSERVLWDEVDAMEGFDLFLKIRYTLGTIAFGTSSGGGSGVYPRAITSFRCFA
jgi:hypothetical protein